MPDGARTARSARCPYMSAMIPCRRRPTAGESSSASTTTRPATRCRPAAKRSIAAGSALRAEGRLTSRRLSASLASPVRAMRVLLGGHRPVPRSAERGALVLWLDVAVGVVEEITVRGGKAHRVVMGSAVPHAHLPQEGPDAAGSGGRTLLRQVRVRDGQ